MHELTEQAVLTLNDLQTIAKDILQTALKMGADQAETRISTNKGFSVGVQKGDVETVEYNQDKVIEIQVFMGKRTGSSSISDVRSEAIRDAVAAACHIAKFTDEDNANGLAETEELAFAYPTLALSYPWGLSVEQAIKLGCECESHALLFDKRIMSAEEVTVATLDATYLYANSNDFIGYYPHTRHEISCVLIAKAQEEMQRDYSYTVAVDPARLQNPKQVANDAASRTINRLGARQIPTTKAPVIFLAEEARSLLGHFVGAISGNNLYRKSSFLLDQLGKKIFPDFVHLKESPHLPHALGSAPFDNNGVATRPNVFVDHGVLQRYALGVYAARKLGLKTTGNAGGVHNLIMKSGDQSLADLIKTLKRGLLVTEMMGHGVNLLTGDYSRGAGGFWIEDGEIKYPVNEITVAGNLRDIYAHILAVGNDVDVRGNIQTGSILIEEMMIGGR